MRHLFFDDDPNRHGHFTTQNIGADIVHVYNVPEACKALETEAKFDELHLDCDMCLLQPPLKFDDGIMVTEYIRDHMPPEKIPGKITIHSWNTHGRLIMRKILREAAKLRGVSIQVIVEEYPI